MSLVHELDQVQVLRNRIADLEALLHDKEQELNQERQNSDRKIRTLTENLPIVLYTIDTEGTVTLSEGKGLAKLGSTPGQSVGQNIFEMYKDHSESQKWIRKALAGESVQSTMSLGSIHMQTWHSPIYDEAGTISGVLGLAIDVTEQKQSEIQLQESHNLLQLVLDTIPVRVFWKDLNSTYLGCNRLFAQDANFATSQKMVGMTDYLLYPDNADAFRADDVKIITSGKSQLNFEEPQLTPDGKQMWLRTSKIPLRNIAGEIVGVLGTYDDITERKQSEIELRESKNRLEMALDGAHLGSWDWDLNTNRTLFDARYEKMLGFEAGELAGESPTHQSEIHPDDMPQMLAQVTAYVEGKSNDYSAEFRTKTKSGEWKWISAKGQFVERDANSKPVRLAGVNQDITARKHADEERETLLANEREARREAQEALRMKDLFLATMSHELRTPLNAMIGFQHLMLFSQQLDADNSHMAERSIANSQRLLNLINNILDISRIATGGLKIVPVTMSPRQLAQGIGTDLSFQAKEKGLNLNVEVADNVPDSITHDEERIGQIMLNLVGNALKFTEKLGTITMRLRCTNERLVIEVQDTGIGIPASQKHVIFDDFVQLDNSSTRKHQGAGLGLAIVKRLALLMQGSITVESEIGMGSTFVVTLPINLNPESYQ